MSSKQNDEKEHYNNFKRIQDSSRKGESNQEFSMKNISDGNP